MNVMFFRRISPVMSKGRLAKGVLAGAAVVAAISVGRAWGTPNSGTQSTLVGRATFNDPINVRRFGEDHWKVSVQAKPALDVAVQTIVFPPGAHSGWHSHPGPVFISVVSGTMTFYEADDPDCEPVVRHAGEGFLDTGEHAHIARNETAEPATNVVVYFAPPGAPLRIDKPDPGTCPF
jgi:hypothetical protein